MDREKEKAEDRKIQGKVQGGKREGESNKDRQRGPRREIKGGNKKELEVAIRMGKRERKIIQRKREGTGREAARNIRERRKAKN